MASFPLVISQFLIVCAAILYSWGPMAQTLPQRGGGSPQGAYEIVKQPSTVIELLENIDLARKQGLLLHEDFYSDAYLKRFLGVLEVERFSYGNERRTSGWVLSFGQMIPPTERSGGRQTKGFSCNFGWRIDAAGLVDAVFSLNLGGSPRVNFDDVERIFGTNWRHPEPISNPDQSALTTTGPHGNETIEYDYVLAGTSQLLRVKFDLDGALSVFSVFAKEIR